MTPPSTARLRVEFATFFIATPVAIAVFVPADSLFPVLFALLVLAIALLIKTPGFPVRRLWQGRVAWLRVLLLAAITAGLSALVVAWLRPDVWLMPGRAAPGFLVAILLIYPLLSAFPQEVIFRVLYFERYAAILPGGHAGLILNATIFSLAHLIYWNWIVAALTFAGGLAFAHSYRDRRSFPEALAMHAVGGDVLFALGMGAWFYSGNVTVPF